MSEIRRHYWDSSVFCSYLNDEPNRAQTVEDLLKEARSGHIEIVTSSFSAVEVLKLKGSNPITEAMEKEVTAFFEYPFIKFFDANRFVCESARQYVWRNNLKPKDAVHVASTALVSKIVTIHELFSWDEDFIKLNGKIPGISFPFARPYMVQTVLNLDPEQSLEEGDASS
jgi:predicted nucleic acid-binding protein